MISILPVHGLPEIREGDDLAAMVAERTELTDGDVLVLAQKVVSKSEGRVIRIDSLEASAKAIERRRVPCVAVSPLVGGRAVKGPADRMLARLAGGTTPAHVASCYEGLIDVLVVDEADRPDSAVPGLRGTVVTDTLMSDPSAARKLAAAAVHAAGTLT